MGKRVLGHGVRSIVIMNEVCQKLNSSPASETAMSSPAWPSPRTPQSSISARKLQSNCVPLPCYSLGPAPARRWLVLRPLRADAASIFIQDVIDGNEEAGPTIKAHSRATSRKNVLKFCSPQICVVDDSRGLDVEMGKGKRWVSQPIGLKAARVQKLCGCKALELLEAGGPQWISLAAYLLLSEHPPQISVARLGVKIRPGHLPWILPAQLRFCPREIPTKEVRLPRPCPRWTLGATRNQGRSCTAA